MTGEAWERTSPAVGLHRASLPRMLQQHAAAGCCLCNSAAVVCALCVRTFTTPYAGSVQLPEENAASKPDTSSAGAAAAAAAPDWMASAAGPDMALLTARDPILFFAEVPLYESELDDNGTAQLSVKVSMPSSTSEAAGSCRH
jgi:TIP41-like family